MILIYFSRSRQSGKYVFFWKYTHSFALLSNCKKKSLDIENTSGHQSFDYEHHQRYVQHHPHRHHHHHHHHQQQHDNDQHVNYDEIEAVLDSTLNNSVLILKILTPVFGFF